MAKKQQELRNEIISKNLKQAFGGEFEFFSNWGYPFSSVRLQKKEKEQTLVFSITFNADTDDYSFATRYEEEGKEKQMEWIQIDSKTIEFIKNTVNGITDQLIAKIKDEEEAPQPEKKAKAKEKVEETVSAEFEEAKVE